VVMSSASSRFLYGNRWYYRFCFGFFQCCHSQTLGLDTTLVLQTLKVNE
jgi:hypothetical protein